MELLTCPQIIFNEDGGERVCGLPAAVNDRYELPSTGGPVEHVKTICAGLHHLNGTLAMFEVSPPQDQSDAA